MGALFERRDLGRVLARRSNGISLQVVADQGRASETDGSLRYRVSVIITVPILATIVNPTDLPAVSASRAFHQEGFNVADDAAISESR